MRALQFDRLRSNQDLHAVQAIRVRAGSLYRTSQ